MNAAYRESARRSFMGFDCGMRVKQALLRKAAPTSGPYAVGDLISFYRDPRKGEAGLQWSVASRIVGFEDEKVTWVLCDGFPVCVATDRMRAPTAAEALAYDFWVKTGGINTLRPREQQQQSISTSTNGEAMMIGRGTTST